MKADKIRQIRALKGRQRIPALTVYDFAMAKMLEGAGIPLAFGGRFRRHGRAGLPGHDARDHGRHGTSPPFGGAAPGRRRCWPPTCLLAVAPLPPARWRTPAAWSRPGPKRSRSKADAACLPQIQAILADGIPLLGHLGMLPQNAVAEGGYHVKGKNEPERLGLIADAMALSEAGAFAIVLELVTAPVAREITAAVSVPTIGIGSGPGCDGEILVTTDLLGTSPNFIPRHVKKNWGFAEQMRAAVVEWRESVVHPQSR